MFDDGGYGVLRNMQDRHLSRRSGVDLFTPDLVAASVAHDFRTWNVENADNFAAAFEAAVATGEPSLVRVDSDAIGPMPVPFVPPVHIPETS